jgi:hypothetical protein
VEAVKAVQCAAQDKQQIHRFQEPVVAEAVVVNILREEAPVVAAEVVWVLLLLLVLAVIRVPQQALQVTPMSL